MAPPRGHMFYIGLYRENLKKPSCLHTCDNLMMAMREIWCSDEGDQGLNEGDFSKLQKGVLNRLIEVFNPLHSGGLSYTQWYNKYGIVHFVL